MASSEKLTRLSVATLCKQAGTASPMCALLGSMLKDSFHNHDLHKILGHPETVQAWVLDLDHEKGTACGALQAALAHVQQRHAVKLLICTLLLESKVMMIYGPGTLPTAAGEELHGLLETYADPARRAWHVTP